MTFASYVGFTEERQRVLGKNAVYPPKFVQQTPTNAICQWTITGMKLLRSTPRVPAEIEAGRLQAMETSAQPDLDMRQRARWKNLAGELARRAKLAASPAAITESK